MEPATSASPPRITVLTTTGEPMQPVRLYYALPRDGRARVIRRLEQLRCVARAPLVPPIWGWWHRDEAATLDFSTFARDARPSRDPVILAAIELPRAGGMIVSVRSFHRALLAARFFAPVVRDRADLIRARMLNRFVAGDDLDDGLEGIDALLDHGVVVKDPRAAEAAWAQAIARRPPGPPTSPAEIEQRCADLFASMGAEDVPEVEDFPLHPEEETPTFTSLKLTLDLRFLRAFHHSHGRTEVTLRDLIVRLAEDVGAAPATETPP